MTVVETDSSGFTFQTLAYIVIMVAGGVAAFVTIFFGIRKFSLKIGNDFETSYIDAFSNEYVEFRKFRVKLGFTIRSIRLPKKFDRSSTINLWYKPSNSFRQEMKKDDYDEDLGKKNKKIKIKDKEFLKSKEIELFRSQMIKKLNVDEISKYNKNINIIPSDDSIKIENKNNEEIHNYSFNLPTTVTYEDAPFYFDNDNVTEIKAVLHEEGNLNEHISDPIMKMTIKKLPSSDEHDNPGTWIVQLPK